MALLVFRQAMARVYSTPASQFARAGRGRRPGRSRGLIEPSKTGTQPRATTLPGNAQQTLLLANTGGLRAACALPGRPCFSRQRGGKSFPEPRGGTRKPPAAELGRMAPSQVACLFAERGPACSWFPARRAEACSRMGGPAGADLDRPRCEGPASSACGCVRSGLANPRHRPWAGAKAQGRDRWKGAALADYVGKAAPPGKGPQSRT